MVRFCPLASGSCGNSTYIGNGNTNILIDAGIPGKHLYERLSKLGISPEDLDAIFITHEHTDHISGAGVISRKYDVPIYATNGTWDVMEHRIGEVSLRNQRVVYADEHLTINDMCLTAYNVPHDASEPVGYTIQTEHYKLAVATDIGHIKDNLREHLSDANVILLESNHDVSMVKKGLYAAGLKRRILGEFGHLSNETAGNFICEIMNSNLRHVLLGHLSKENNTPDLAYQTVANTLSQNDIKLGMQLKLSMAIHNSSSALLELP